MVRFKNISDCSTESTNAFITKLSKKLSDEYTVDNISILTALNKFVSHEVQCLRPTLNNHKNDLPIEDLTFKTWVNLTRQIAKHLKSQKIIKINGSKLLNIVALVFGFKTTHIFKAKCNSYKMVAIDPHTQTIELKAITSGLSNLYAELDCSYIEGLSVVTYTFMCDEEAKLKRPQPTFVITIKEQELEILGKGLFCLNNPDGDYENISESEFEQIKSWILFK